MARITDYRTDPDMCELLVRGSRDTIMWMRSKGIRFLPIYGRQAYKVDGKFTFWGGLTVETMPSPPPVEDGALGDAGVLVLLGTAQSDRTLEELTPAAETVVSAPPVAGDETTGTTTG